jgi:hypothetical protein
VRPSPEQATDHTSLECPRSARSSWPEGTSHRRTVWSQLADTRPAGQNATALTRSAWPFKVASSRPEATSHRRIVLSTPPEARVWPSPENARASTAS